MSAIRFACNRAILTFVLLSLAGCMLLPKRPKKAKEAPSAAEVASKEKQRQDAGDAEVLRLIKAAPITANPVVENSVDPKLRGGWAGRGVPRDNLLFGGIIEASLASYKAGTLCIEISRVHRESSGERTHLSPTIRDNYFLYAPETLDTFQGTRSITAARVTLTDFAAQFENSTFEQRGDKIVKEDHYMVEDSLEVCFDDVERILSPSAAFSAVEFQYDSGKQLFAYAWRFAKEQ